MILIKPLIKAVEGLTFVSLMMYIVGCATGGIATAPSLTSNTKLSHDQGIVIAKIVNAGGHPLSFNQLALAPKNLNTSKNIKTENLKAINTPLTTTTLFAAPVTVGSYSLHSIRSHYHSSRFRYSPFATTDAKFGTFEVIAGQVTDLGTIVYYPKPAKDKYIDLLLRLKTDETAQILKDYFPFYNNRNQKINSWNDNDLDEERQNNYISVAQNPVTYNVKYLAPDNSLYFIGKLGVIIKRSADGDWSVDAVDINSDLTTIEQNIKGDLLVGGNEGKIFLKRAGESNWKNISLSVNNDIEQVIMKNDGHIDIITRQETDLSIYRASIVTPTPVWKKMAYYNSVEGWKQPNIKTDSNRVIDTKDSSGKERIDNVSIEKEKERHFISIVLSSMEHNYAIKSGEMTTYQYNPVTWEVAEEEIKIAATFSSGVTKLGVDLSRYWNSKIPSSYYKFNKKTNKWREISGKTFPKSCGKNDKELDTKCHNKEKLSSRYQKSFSFLSPPWFHSELSATAIVTVEEQDLWTRDRTLVTKIITTKDGGEIWRMTGYELPNKYCTDIVVSVKEHLLLSCNGVSSDMYKSHDYGKSWEQVREQENF